LNEKEHDGRTLTVSEARARSTQHGSHREGRPGGGSRGGAGKRGRRGGRF
jgi:hypothetical protein